MKHCYVVREHGYALIDESGVVVGEVIDLDRQILGKNKKRLKQPSRWFEMHVHKKRDNRKIGA